VLIKYIKKKVHQKFLQVHFRRDYNQFKKLSKEDRGFSLKWSECYPILNEKTFTTEFDKHYIYHTAWAARILSRTRPSEHVDISSSLYFVSMVSAFIPIHFYDYRPPKIKLSNLTTGRADLLSLPFGDDTVESLSCMHVVEHIGLGRYGDKIGPNDDLFAMAELKRVLAPGGNLLFVVPVGMPKVIFNAHRIYSYRQVMKSLQELELVNFSLIPDSPAEGEFIEDATEEMANRQCYGCGCFWMNKPI